MLCQRPLPLSDLSPGRWWIQLDRSCTLKREKRVSVFAWKEALVYPIVFLVDLLHAHGPTHEVLQQSVPKAEERIWTTAGTRGPWGGRSCLVD